jgi:hypothetical protein
MLCLSHAIITDESMDGIAMRMAELVWLKGEIPFQSFINGDFQLEFENTEAALLGFDASRAKAAVDEWTERIKDGRHRPLEFNGA